MTAGERGFLFGAVGMAVVIVLVMLAGLELTPDGL